MVQFTAEVIWPRKKRC